MNAPLRVTATFLDEVTCDIIGHNWGPVEWDAEFASFVAAGIDTVVLIRSGWANRLSHPSKVISSRVTTLPVYFDMLELFLELSDKHGIKFFFGLYDSMVHWNRMDWKGEVEINRPYIREVWDNYGHHKSFAGWYLPHETYDTGYRIMDLNRALSEICKTVQDLPVLASPYWLGRYDMNNGFGGPLGHPHTLTEIVTQWEEVLEAYSGLVDIVAFQDGTVYEQELGPTLKEMRRLADSSKIELWTNVETFDRDMPIKFSPIEWRKLVHKLTVAEEHVEKAITFEFSHFLSPNSIWPSARNLYNRYSEYLEGSYRRLDSDPRDSA